MATTKWGIDPTHSEISFRVKHMMISTVTGWFESFEADAETENDDFTGAKINFSADTTSINTRNEMRDNHLRSGEFFDSENFPKMTFKASGFEKKGSGDQYVLSGDLTIRGVTKPVSLDVEFGGVATDPWGNLRAGFEINGEINRKDFGLNWSAVTEAGGVVVSDAVKIHSHVELIKS
ncbi:MAG: YceI family protein [Bacteroidetes bacterium]|nr:YceI family protein [Bacteroidota bacterium]